MPSVHVGARVSPNILLVTPKLVALSTESSMSSTRITQFCTGTGRRPVRTMADIYHLMEWAGGEPQRALHRGVPFDRTVGKTVGACGRQRTLRPRARPREPGRRDPRPGPGHRHRRVIRLGVDDRRRRDSDDPGGRKAGAGPSLGRHRGHRHHRAARLLLDQRDPDLQGVWPVCRGRGGRWASRVRRRTTGSGSSIRWAD